MTTKLTTEQLCDKYELTEKELAFALWLIEDNSLSSLEDFSTEWTQGAYNPNVYENSSIEYLVCDDDEANDEWDNNLENYIEECVLDEIPEAYRSYFDNEAFKRDCEIDGRGHSLSSYDGNEIEYTLADETYYFYRTN